MKNFSKPLLCAGLAICLLHCSGPQTPSTDVSVDRDLVANIDSSIRPQDNFYLFVNGKWIEHNEVPPTETNIGSFYEVDERTRKNLRSILDSVSTSTQIPGSLGQKVGDLYSSGMDSVNIEKVGFEPLKPYFQKIEAIGDVKGLMQFEAEKQKEYYSYIIGLYIGADQKNANANIAGLYQTGLGLPDRDYYFKTDSASIAVQHAYKTYMRNAFILTGDDSVMAKKRVTAVYDLEKKIAGSHRTNVELRDPQSNYHKVSVKELDKKMPVIGWSVFLNNVGIKTDSVDLAQPAYYQKLSELLKQTPINTWKSFYKFHIIDDAAPYLNMSFANAKFDYSNRALYGQQEMRPRWRRVYATVDNNLGQALGQLYIKKYFPEAAKKRMLELVSNLEKAFDARISKLDWMGDSTKLIAKDKLHSFLKKIGYPDKWRDYSKLTIARKSYFDNILACSINNFNYSLAKLNKPVDKTEWLMTPPTIDAYYNPTVNEIVFPAGILQSPFFDLNVDDAVNYGGIGMAIGHEMTHGFDDQGSQYDKNGNLRNWWAKEDKEKFQAKTKMVIDQYNQFIVLDTVHVNGALTTGENMADMGGISIAYDAFKMTKQGQDTARIDGFTPDQRFFMSYARIWKSKSKKELERQMINTNPHSPPMYRINGPLMNFDPFYRAFDVKAGDKMYKADNERVHIW